VDKTVDNDIAWSHREVIHIAFHDNVFSGLNFGFVTQATGGEERKESLFIFFNGSMFSSHVSESST